MFLNMDWEIKIGSYKLGLLSGCEIHRSVDLLAATCTISLPGSAYNQALKIEDYIKRGDKVSVSLGYNGQLNQEFNGYLHTIHTDDGKLTLDCEDELFTFRKNVADNQFSKTTIKDIVTYCLSQIRSTLKLDCTLTIDYDKFVISKAQAYDVLKKLKEETKAN